MIGAAEFIRPQDLARELGIARSTLRKWRKRPDFPRSYQLGQATRVYRRDEINRWIASRQEAAA